MVRAPMKIGLTGASGFLGTALARQAVENSHTIVPFSRNPQPGGRKFSLDAAVDCSGLDAMIHLAGEPVLGLWTASKRRRIRESRILGTRQVVEGMAAATPRPRVLVAASAVGYYGDTKGRPVDESAPRGEGFLAGVCREWESEATRAEAFGVRVVCLRIGFVLGPGGGALKFIVPLFRAGLGGRLGDGQQGMSGVHVDDVGGMALWAAGNAEVSGALNAVMHKPFSNGQFTKAVASAVHRPAFLPAPAFVLRAVLGDLAGMLLGDCRVLPRKASALGYRFQHPDLDAAIQASVFRAQRASPKSLSR